MPSEDRGAAERGGVDELEGRLETEARAALESLYPHTNKELNQYVDILASRGMEWGLIGPREGGRLWQRHVANSLALVDVVGTGLDVADVGSGAGLPGVVLAIVRPAWQVVCVDAVAKKAGFVRQVAAELGLPKLRAEHARVETLRIPAFDLITSRAFASLADFATLTRQHLAPGGVWLAMKGEPSADELEALPDGVRLRAVQPLQVPGLAARRCAVWLELAENSAAPPDHPLR